MTKAFASTEEAGFDERWLAPYGIVPVDPVTTGILIREIQRLRGEVMSLRNDLDATAGWDGSGDW